VTKVNKAKEKVFIRMEIKDLEKVFELIQKNIHSENIGNRSLFSQPALSMILNIIDEKEFASRDSVELADNKEDSEIFRLNKDKDTPFFISMAYLLHMINGKAKKSFHFPTPLTIRCSSSLREVLYQNSMEENTKLDINLDDFINDIKKKKKVDLYSVIKLYYNKLEKENKKTYEKTKIVEFETKNIVPDEILIQNYISSIDEDLEDILVFSRSIGLLANEFQKLVKHGVFGQIPPNKSENEYASDKLLLCLSEYMECLLSDLQIATIRKQYQMDKDYFENFAKTTIKFINEIDLRFISLTDKILMVSPLIAFKTNIEKFYLTNYLQNDESFVYLLQKPGRIRREYQTKYIQVFYSKLKPFKFEEKTLYVLLKILDNFSEFAELYSAEYDIQMPKRLNEESLSKLLQTKFKKYK